MLAHKSSVEAGLASDAAGGGKLDKFGAEFTGYAKGVWQNPAAALPLIARAMVRCPGAMLRRARPLEAGAGSYRGAAP